MVTVYIALGSNLGDRAQNLHDAITLLSPKVVVEELSPVYETEPHHITSQPSFYKMIIGLTQQNKMSLVKCSGLQSFWSNHVKPILR